MFEVRLWYIFISNFIQFHFKPIDKKAKGARAFKIISVLF